MLELSARYSMGERCRLVVFRVCGSVRRVWQKWRSASRLYMLVVVPVVVVVFLRYGRVWGWQEWWSAACPPLLVVVAVVVPLLLCPGPVVRFRLLEWCMFASVFEHIQAVTEAV